jgi:hypothetical protein
MTGSVPYPQEYDVLKIGTSFFFSMDRKKKTRDSTPYILLGDSTCVHHCLKMNRSSERVFTENVLL